MLAPGHPLPRPNASDDTQRIVTLLPAAQVMQVFVCHPMASQDRDRQQFFFTAILEDADVSEDQPVGGREERSQSFHKRLKHSAFGMSPDEWHNFDSRIQGQLARVFISVDTTGDILGGATRQIEAQTVEITPISTTIACTEWMERNIEHLQNLMSQVQAGTVSVDALAVAVGKTLSSADAFAASLQTTLRLIVYYREWEVVYRQTAVTKMKRAHNAAVKAARQENRDIPAKPDYQRVVGERTSPVLERACELFTTVSDLVGDCIEMCAIAGSEVEDLESLLHGVYSHVEISGEELW